jgi:hypothetical protein
MTRRQFLVRASVTAGALTFPSLGRAAVSDDLPMRPLGRTNERVSSIGLGGFHIGQQEDEAESVRIIRTAIDRGIRFLDNCWDYNDGESERRMGKALRDGYRTGIDSLRVLDQAVDAARTFRRLSEQQVAALRQKTAAVAKAGRYELFKTSDHFDGTAHNPQWLG